MAKNKEWEKEMMKWKKIDIVNLLEKTINENKQSIFTCQLKVCAHPFEDNCNGCFHFR